MLLKDIMTKDVLTLSPNDSLEKAAELFVEHGISGAPVIDAFNNVIGMLTEGDLVRQQKPLTKPLFLMLLTEPSLSISKRSRTRLRKWAQPLLPS